MGDSTLNHEAETRLSRLESFASSLLHAQGFHKENDEETATAHIDRAMVPPPPESEAPAEPTTEPAPTEEV